MIAHPVGTRRGADLAQIGRMLAEGQGTLLASIAVMRWPMNAQSSTRSTWTTPTRPPHPVSDRPAMLVQVGAMGDPARLVGSWHHLPERFRSCPQRTHRPARPNGRRSSRSIGWWAFLLKIVYLE